MTDEEINRLVAEKVMGFHTSMFDEVDFLESAMDYCNDWDAMGEVIEKIDLVFEMSRDDNISYSVKFIEFYPDSEKSYFPHVHKFHTAEAESAPKAVALAALKAKGIDIENNQT